MGALVFCSTHCSGQSSGTYLHIDRRPPVTPSPDLGDFYDFFSEHGPIEIRLMGPNMLI